MDKQEIDQLFKKAIDESADFYSSAAQESKYKIWNRLSEKKNQNNILIIRLLAAACILLLFSCTFFAYEYMNSRKDIHFLKDKQMIAGKNLQESVRTIAYLNTYIQGMRQKSDHLETTPSKIIYKTNIQTINTTDTVYKERVVYVMEKPAEKKEVQPSYQTPEKKDTNIVYRSLMITNITPNKSPIKASRFKIKLGGSQNKGNDEALALSTRF